ncbi:MAG TPA: AAA-like domain-containing protein [Candidatus Sericytochromatia bacterium]
MQVDRVHSSQFLTGYKGLLLYFINLQSAVTAAFSRVLSTTEPVELEQVQGFKLQRMGLVNQQENRVTLSCELYRQYFGDRVCILKNSQVDSISP